MANVAIICPKCNAWVAYHADPESEIEFTRFADCATCCKPIKETNNG